jgi:hypothetical protein
MHYATIPTNTCIMVTIATASNLKRLTTETTISIASAGSLALQEAVL